MKTSGPVKLSSKSASTKAGTAPSASKTPWHTSVLAATLPIAYRDLVPTYKSRSYPHLLLKVEKWSNEYGIAVSNISSRRAQNRLSNYLVPEELKRVGARLESTDSASIRFGVKKEGHGYHGDRGDFCLTSGAIDGKHLTLFYRSLELIGGLAYDLCIINELSKVLGIEWRSVTIHAARANVFALKGNSNEKLYPKFKEVLGL